MIRAFVTAAALALAAPVAAETDPAPRPFLEQWADEMMRGLMQDLTPELERFMAEVGPEFEALLSEVVPRLNELMRGLGGLSNYQMPEVLPNGDILIRRRPEAPPVTVDPETNAPIDL